MASRWYVVHVYSGFEKRVAQTLSEQARAQEMDDLIEEVLVPTEEVIEMRRGARRSTERKFFPGYVLVKMEMTPQSQHLVQTQPKVTGFLGSSGRPTPLSESDAARIKRQVAEGVERPRPRVTFEIGEQVRVADGPFSSFNGFVEDVDEERARLKVAVSIFGRSTPVDLEYGQVEKM
ncbi:MAG: transcription termination/antitermination protein NusG [Alphaproteobacteria bacterium]|nr:transcription termination/antitermination protein NusG [Alphaproteobacteria bacterium]